MSLQQIPLDSSPNQTFAATLNVNDALLNLSLALSYNGMAGYWQMDVADAQGNLVLAGVPLITGSFPAANVLQQYGYLSIGSAYLINASADEQDYPGSSNLGTDYQLWWGDN